MHEFHLKALFAQVSSIMIWICCILSGNTFRDWDKKFVKFWEFCFIFVIKFRYRFRLLNFRYMESHEWQKPSLPLICSRFSTITCVITLQFFFQLKKVSGHFLNIYFWFISQSSFTSVLLENIFNPQMPFLIYLHIIILIATNPIHLWNYILCKVTFFSVALLLNWGRIISGNHLWNVTNTVTVTWHPRSIELTLIPKWSPVPFLKTSPSLANELKIKFIRRWRPCNSESKLTIRVVLSSCFEMQTKLLSTMGSTSLMRIV